MIRKQILEVSTLLKILPIVVFFLAISACEEEKNPHLITKQSIGFLTDSTTVKDLKTIFQNDSIVKFVGGDEFTGAINDIDVYSKNGELLLTLTPSEALDSTSTIKTVTIKDARYKTAKGINASSTFGELQQQYKISSIQNTLKNVVVMVNEINAFIAIDKKELPANLQYDMRLKIDAVQIPDDAKIKNFSLYW